MRTVYSSLLFVLVCQAQYFQPEWWGDFKLDQLNCDLPTGATQPFIGNDAFWDYANVTFSPGHTLHTFVGIKIFLHTKDIAAFSKACQIIRDPFILITRSNLDEIVPYHHSDDQQNLLPAYTAVLQHTQLIRWFASNTVLQDPKLTGLPLGPKWQWTSTKFHGEDSTKSALLKILSHHALDVASNFYSKQKTGLLFSSLTESSSDQATYAPWRGSRRQAVKVLQLSFPSVQDKRLTVDKQTLVSTGSCRVRRESEEYLLKLQQYRFVLSPPGNGPDAHRTWEALLMGCIPIVMSGPLNELYQGLPVLILESWDELTPGKLDIAYTELRYGHQEYAFEKLFTPYWFGLIDRAVESTSQQ